MFSNGFNTTDSTIPFYTVFRDSRGIRKGRRKHRARPAKFFANLGGSSGIGLYSDDEETDFTGMGAGTDQSQLTTTPWYEQIGKAVTSVLTPQNAQAFAMYKLEKQKNAINLERAKNGQPPIELATATVGLSPDTKRFITYGAIGLAALFILPKLLKG